MLPSRVTGRQPHIFLAATLLLLSPAAAQTVATGDSRHVTEPHYPAICTVLTAQFSTSQRSSPPTPDDTDRLQTALNTCAGTGRAVLLIGTHEADAFYSTQITVNGEGLVVAPGITLEGNNGYAKQSELVLIEGANSFLGGPGAIDGRGDILTGGTPRLVQGKKITNLVVYNITLQQAAHPNLYVENGDGLTIWRIKIRTPANRHNADGIDIDSLTNATVAFSSIEAGDDGVAVKTNSAAASNITVVKNQLYGTHGLSIGSQTFHGVTNVLFLDNFVYGVDLEGNPSTDANAIRIKSDATCGGLVKQVTYQNTCMKQAKHLIILNTYYGTCSGTPGIPQYTDIVINGARSIDSVSGAYESFTGYSASYPLEVYLAHIDLDSATQLNDQYAQVYLHDSNITPSGPGVTTRFWYAKGEVPHCKEDEDDKKGDKDDKRW
jgi:polygalacturonase